MSTSRLNIAIIGAGASGTITTIQLLNKLKAKANLFLIEKQEKTLFRGAAYSSQLAYEPLNVQAGRMSIYNHLPDHFYNWVVANRQAQSETEITRDSFVSRRWFGDYLTQNFEEAKRQSENVTVEIVIANCTDIAFNSADECYTLSFENRNDIQVDYLVFGCGNEPPADVLEKEEVKGDKYIRNPWVVDPFENLNPIEDVLLIGTGLTMVDHVVSLQKRQHKGKIFCFSRNGYLPLQHAPVQHFVFDINHEAKEARHALDLLRQNTAVASKQDISWQNVMDALRPYTAVIWKRMSLDSKKYFLQRLRTYWEIHRHRMPLASANCIQELRDSGQLKLVAGNIQSVECKGDTMVVHYVPKGDKIDSTLAVHHIINCTGPLNDYHQTSNTLIKNLLNKGWMKQDALKLGIETGARGEIIKSNGVVLNHAFAIGPLRKAAEWESTAIREIRTQAENVALAIVLPSLKNYEMAVESGL